MGMKPEDCYRVDLAVDRGFTAIFEELDLIGLDDGEVIAYLSRRGESDVAEAYFNWIQDGKEFEEATRERRD